MKDYAESINPIEVEFHDVAEATSAQSTNINETTKKILFKRVGATLQKKTKSIGKNKPRLIKTTTRVLSFCKKLGNISFLKKWILDVPKLCDMLIDTLNGVYKGIPYSSLVMVAIAFIYTISPIDILCDKIPILGVLDDAAIIKIVLDTIKNDLETYSSWKITQEAT